ncbi:ammonium transporter Rh type B-like isoform X2 [Homarus americanus]|uniref:ammonium transporter Rh type B-like isoform X2 n=1 Tax=Homarus americanus TaxID=6706 RepID=UPI001C456945|nr:ammonium transporter Rh type B-like isoform X2 [Homarus americanus]
MVWLVARFGWFVTYAALVEGVVLLVFMGYVRYDTFYDVNKWNYTRQHGHSTPDLQTFYPILQEVQVMVVLGFGFMMTFLRRYSHSGLTLNLLLTALTLQLAIITRGFFTTDRGFINLNILSMVDASFTCGAVLVSVGAALGKTSPTQLLLMSVLEVPVYHLNSHLGHHLLAAVDHGGSIFIHTFGAYFGVAFSRCVTRKVVHHHHHPNNTSSYTSNLFSMLGTLLLWVYWPSFNGVVESGRSQGRAVLNTYLALSGSTMGALITSSLTHKLYLQYPMMVPAANTSFQQDLDDLAPGEGRTAGQQALYQALATFITLLLAVVFGGAVGFLLTFAPFDPLTQPRLYTDAPWWELPEDGEEEELIKEEVSNGGVRRIFNIQVGERGGGRGGGARLPSLRDGE